MRGLVRVQFWFSRGKSRARGRTALSRNRFYRVAREDLRRCVLTARARCGGLRHIANQNSYGRGCSEAFSYLSNASYGTHSHARSGASACASRCIARPRVGPMLPIGMLSRWLISA